MKKELPKKQGGRPKAHPQEDRLAMVPYTNSDSLVPPAWKDVISIDERERLTIDRLISKAHHRIAAGYSDPLSVLQALDCIERASPAFRIRAKYMSIYLNASQTALYWSAVTAGRIIGELTEVAADAFGKDRTPIIGDTDYKGNYWVIDSSVDTYKWFWQLRKELTELVQKMQENEAQGLYRSADTSVFTQINTEAPK